MKLRVSFDLDVELWSKYEERYRDRSEEERVNLVFSEESVNVISLAVSAYKVENFKVEEIKDGK